MCFSIILIGYIIYKTFKIIEKHDICSYKELLDVILPKKKMKYINLENILNFIINIFLLTTFFIMCAGFSAYFNQEFKINVIYSGIIIAISSYIILNKNMKGIFIINSILMPVIIIILIILGIKSSSANNMLQISTNNPQWIINAILYSSYNTITLSSVLIPMKKHIKQKKDYIKIVAISSIIIIMLGIIIFLLLSNIKTDISKIELPAVYASRKYWKNIPVFIRSNNTRSNHYNSCIISIWLSKQYIRKRKTICFNE